MLSKFLIALSASASAAMSLSAGPTGSYCGSVPVILDDKITFNSDGTADFDVRSAAALSPAPTPNALTDACLVWPD